MGLITSVRSLEFSLEDKAIICQERIILISQKNGEVAGHV